MSLKSIARAAAMAATLLTGCTGPNQERRAEHGVPTRASIQENLLSSLLEAERDQVCKDVRQASVLPDELPPSNLHTPKAIYDFLKSKISIAPRQDDANFFYDLEEILKTGETDEIGFAYAVRTLFLRSNCDDGHNLNPRVIFVDNDGRNAVCLFTDRDGTVNAISTEGATMSITRISHASLAFMETSSNPYELHFYPDKVTQLSVNISGLEQDAYGQMTIYVPGNFEAGLFDPKSVIEPHWYGLKYLDIHFADGTKLSRRAPEPTTSQPGEWIVHNSQGIMVIPFIGDGREIVWSYRDLSKSMSPEDYVDQYLALHMKNLEDIPKLISPPFITYKETEGNRTKTVREVLESGKGDCDDMSNFAKKLLEVLGKRHSFDYKPKVIAGKPLQEGEPGHAVTVFKNRDGKWYVIDQSAEIKPVEKFEDLSTSFGKDYVFSEVVVDEDRGSYSFSLERSSGKLSFGSSDERITVNSLKPFDGDLRDFDPDQFFPTSLVWRNFKHVQIKLPDGRYVGFKKGQYVIMVPKK